MMRGLRAPPPVTMTRRGSSGRKARYAAAALLATAAFLGLQPRNLSTGFRVETTFGVDYRHQAVATTDVPAKMRAKLQAELPRLVGAENLADVQVAFAGANSSSLDYAVWADLRGAAAPLRTRLPGLLQRLLVEACNENGWTIPFPQLTVHRE